MKKIIVVLLLMAIMLFPIQSFAERETYSEREKIESSIKEWLEDYHKEDESGKRLIRIWLRMAYKKINDL